VPLKAVIEGKTVIGPDLTREEWADLKIRHRKGLPVTMACCGAPGHLRVSKTGIQHFYHGAAAGCTYAEESREHLEIKERIYRICTSEHWDTSVEFPAPDRSWISDVYAIRDDRKVVFEIQVSAISLAELEERETKYLAGGIESYWLLDTFPGRSGIITSRYVSHRSPVDDPSGDTIPYIDPSLFETGPENHLFIATGIRSIGLRAKKQTLFTTNNPEISLADWVREVLKGNYRNYLEETSAAYHRKRRLKDLAAPALLQFRELYQRIIRDETYRKTVDRQYRIIKTHTAVRNGKALRKTFDELYVEIDWLGNEYRSCIAEGYGLFSWKTMEHGKSRPFFRLDSELKVRRLQECILKFSRWEASFQSAISSLERESGTGKKRVKE